MGLSKKIRPGDGIGGEWQNNENGILLPTITTRPRIQEVLICRNKWSRPLFYLIPHFLSKPSVANERTPGCRRKRLEGTGLNFFDMSLEPSFALFGPLANVVPTCVPDVCGRKPWNILWRSWKIRSVTDWLKWKNIYYQHEHHLAHKCHKWALIRHQFETIVVIHFDHIGTCLYLIQQLLGNRLYLIQRA